MDLLKKGLLTRKGTDNAIITRSRGQTTLSSFGGKGYATKNGTPEDLYRHSFKH